MLYSKKLRLLSFVIAILAISSCDEELFKDVIVRENTTQKLDSLVTEIVKPADSVTAKTDSLITKPDSVVTEIDSLATQPGDSLTTQPVDSLITDPVDTVTTAPVDTVTTNPVDPVETDPVDPVETDPVDPPTTDPVDVPPPPASFANVIYEETVEGPDPFSTAHDFDVGSWDYALQFVKSPAYKGLRSARFEVHEDQDLVANGKRSEITIIKGAEMGMAKEMWYSFAVYFPSVGYEYDSERDCINQWFQGQSPATSIRTAKDRILLESGNTLDSRARHDIGPIVKDTWHTVVMHFVHSYGSDGLIELWYDGVRKLTIRGGNMYDDILPKWKIGLYKAAFKAGTSDVTRRIIYFDDVRVGDKTSTYETMTPNR
jgi:hypothetical protein